MSSLPNTEKTLNAFAQPLPTAPIFQLKLPSTGTSSMYCLNAILINISPAHPFKTRLTAEARIKTDKIDSPILAHLLRTNSLPTSYIPSRYIRDLTELLRSRAPLVSLKTSLKIKFSLSFPNGVFPPPYYNVLGKKGFRFPQNLKHPRTL